VVDAKAMFAMPPWSPRNAQSPGGGQLDKTTQGGTHGNRGSHGSTARY
jgi:hypothetical protein